MKPLADNDSRGHMHDPTASKQHGKRSIINKHTQNPCKMGQISIRKESSPTQQDRIHIKMPQHRAQAEPNPSQIISSNIPQKLENIHNRTSLGIQPLFTEAKIQSNILSSALGAPGDSKHSKPIVI